MDSQALIRSVDETGAIAFLSRLVQFKSYSGAPGETELAEHLAGQMEAIGLTAELQAVDGPRRNAIGWLHGAGGGQSLLFNGHMDTNPATEGWTVDPWAGLTRDGCIYGIGVSNMKAGDAAYYWAVKTLIDNGVTLKGDVVLTYVVGELQGGVGTVQAIEQGLRADYFINAEPTDLNALTLHAGAFDFAIELTGITRHVSKREEAVDAVLAACALVPRLDEMTFTGALNEEHASVNRCNVGVLRASLSPEFHDWRPPQVADFARMLGTGRYAPSQSEASVLADIRHVLDDLEREFPGLKAEARKSARSPGALSMPPFEVSKSSPVVTAVAEAYREVRGADQRQGAVRPYCFYGTDAAHLLRRAGMEGVVCGPGGKYNTMPDERVEIVDFLDMIRIYMLAIIRVCGVA